MYILLWVNLRRFVLPKIWSAYRLKADINSGNVDIAILTDIPQMTSKFVAVVSLSHFQGNCNLFAAVR